MSSMQVHRSRFVDWVPSGVRALAAHPLDQRILAVGRDDGSIEIWHCDAAKPLAKPWFLHQRYTGFGDNTVTALAWLPDGTRLLSAGLHGLLTLWDTVYGVPDCSFDAVGGAVWDMAVSHAGTALAVACDDGSVRLFDLEDGVAYQRRLTQHSKRALCVAFLADDSAVVSGSASGSLLHTPISRADPDASEFRIRLEASGDASAAAVWSVLALADGTLVTGDASGRTCFWDSRYGTQLQAFRQHEATVSALLACGTDHVFASGVDAKLAMFSRVGSDWTFSYSRRQHTHDVTALAAAGDDVVISAGVDTQMFVYRVASFAKRKAVPARLSSFPNRPLATWATSPVKGDSEVMPRIMAFQHARHVDVWRLGTPSWEASASQSRSAAQSLSASIKTAVYQQPALLLRLAPKLASNIACAALSPDARFLALSDRARVRLFALDYDANLRVTVSKADAHLSPLGVCARTGADTLVWTPDSSRLVIAAARGVVRVVDVAAGTSLTAFHHHTGIPGQGSVFAAPAGVIRASVSPDGQWLATADVLNRIHVFNLDTLQHHAALPVLETALSALAFHPGNPRMLVATVRSNRFFIYDVEQRRLSDWSREFGQRLPRQFLASRDPLCFISFNPARRNTIVLASHSAFWYIDLELPPPDVNAVLKRITSTSEDQKLQQQQQKQRSGKRREVVYRRKRKAEALEAAAQGSNTFVCVERYKPLLYVDFIARDGLLVLERPWLAIAQHLPDPLYLSRYGT